MRINTNLTAMNTFNQVTKNQNKISSAVAQLSSGSAITSAADNAAGLAISEKMRAQIRGLDKASSNAQDAISLVQTAEGALSSATSILQRMRELAVQSSSDTNNNDIDRTALQDEFNQLQNELNDIASNTTFNKKNLLDGSLSSTKSTITGLSLANSSLGVSLGKAASGSYSFAVKVKEETPAVAGSVATAKSSQTAASYNFIASNGTSTTLQSTAAATKTSQYNGNYALSTKINDDKSITVTATGDNGASFTANIDAATLSAGIANGGTVDMKFGDGKTAFTTTLTLGTDYVDSDNARQALADDIKNVAVSVTGGVDKKDATYANYATMTGAEDVKLAVGDTSATFSNGITVSFDKLTTTDLTVGYTADNIKYNYSAADVTSAFNAVHPGATVGAITVEATISGASKSLADQSIVIGNTGTVTIGDYTSTTDLQTMALSVDSDGAGAGTALESAVQTLTMRNAAGDEFTIDFQAFEAAGADNSTVTDAATYTSGTAVVGIGGLTETVNANYSYAVTDANPTVADTTTFNSATGNATATYSNIKITSGVENNTVDLSSLSFDQTAVNAGDVTFTVVDNAGNSYTSTLAAGDYNGKASFSKTMSFTSTANNVTFTMDLTVAVDTVGDTLSSGDSAAYNPANITLATVNSTFANQTGVLSDSLAVKTGVASDAGNKTTTASTFKVNTAANAGLTFQVGANSGDTMTINIDKMDSKTLGINSAKIDTQAAAEAAVKSVDRAINTISAQRATLGAIQNRLSDKINNLNTSSENLTSAESQIRDVDMAKKMTEFTNANILSQASTAMLAQANSLPQSVLSLIGK